MIRNQIIIGEKIKSILRKNFGKSTCLFKYQELKEGRVDLVITWTTKTNASSSVTFLAVRFNINEKKVEGTTDHDIYIVSLSDIMGNSFTRLTAYHKDASPREKFSDAHIERIIEELELSKAPKEVVVPKIKPIVQDPKPEVVDAIELPEVVNLKESDTTDGEKESTSDLKQEELNRKIKRYRSVFEFFLTKILMFERQFKNSRLLDLHNDFLYDDHIDGYIQTLNCKDEYAAIAIEMVIRWQLDYYEDLSIYRVGNKITVDCSIFFEREISKKSTGGSFCFIPTDDPRLKEMEIRFHRICYTGDPIITEGINCFDVCYPTNEKTKRIHTWISRMGWKAEIDQNHLLIITGEKLTPPTISKVNKSKKEVMLSLFKNITFPNNINKEVAPLIGNIQKQKVLEIPKPEEKKTSLVVNGKRNDSAKSLDNLRQFSGSKAEAIETLQKIYLSPKFLTFSPDAQKKISSVIQKYWIEEHPEDYALSIVGFLELET